MSDSPIWETSPTLAVGPRDSPSTPGPSRRRPESPPQPELPPPVLRSTLALAPASVETDPQAAPVARHLFHESPPPVFPCTTAEAPARVAIHPPRAAPDLRRPPPPVPKPTGITRPPRGVRGGNRHRWVRGRGRGRGAVRPDTVSFSRFDLEQTLHYLHRHPLTGFGAGPRVRYYDCRPCNYRTSDVTAYDEHLAGGNHRGNCDRDNCWRCDICQVTVTSGPDLSRHLTGKSHKRRVKNISSN